MELADLGPFEGPSEQDQPQPQPWPCPTCGKDQPAGKKMPASFPAVLDIGDGSASVRCATCEREVDWDGDNIAYQAEGIPVTVTWAPEHEGLGGWHGDVRCDCGWTWEITLRPKVAAS
jgi:endogenous inhibitor of DNA gyrase (YacG/DUF329 family)